MNYNLKEETNEPQKIDKQNSVLFEWGEALVMSLSVLVIIFVFFVRLIGVDGLSMYPTLNDRDRIFITDVSYQPQKGDVVVLTKDSFMSEPIVKRVIATEGDMIDINYDSGDVTINGEVMDESYINERISRKNVGDMEFPQTVPQGCIFVMGDNRNHSSDSRVSSLGMVDERYVLGKVFIRIMPLSSFGAVG